MVATDACRRATWDSSAIVILSRKRRWTRVLTVRRNQVAVDDTPSPRAAASTSGGRPSSTPFPNSMSQSAMSASGNIESCDRTNAASINRGSWRYPSLQSRHIDDSAGGRSSRGGVGGLVEDVIGHALFVF